MSKSMCVIIFCCAMILAGCSEKSETKDLTSRFTLPKELEGYKIYSLDSSYDSSTNGRISMYVIVPANDKTEKPVMLFEHHVKGPNIVVVIDGKKYNVEEQKLEKE